MEYIEGQEVLDDLADSGAYNEQDVQSLYQQLLEGIAYLHESHVCHRDIKPSNILITKDKQRVILVDFNVAKKIPEGDDFFMITRAAGAVAFVAPERLAENSVYTEKVDMWAVGIVLYMLLVGSHPFECEGSIMHLYDQILNGEAIIKKQIEQVEGVSEGVKGLLMGLIRTNPLDRLSAR